MVNPKLLYSGVVATGLPWRAPAHRHDHHELVVIAEGHIHLAIDGEQLLAGPGEALFYRSGRVHDERSAAGEPLRTYFVGFVAQGLSAGIPVRVADRAGRLRQLARWLYEERGGERPEIREAGRIFLQALLAELARLATDTEAPLLREVRAYVSRHLAEPFGVAALAAHVGMSKYHFIRVYRAAAGCTPMAAVRVLRVEAARDLILTTDLPLKQVAEHCGLGNPQHFARVFRAQVGQAPGTLRGARRPWMSS